MGTGHGINPLDPETGKVKLYTVADGLPRGVVEQAFGDRHGGLWFGTPFGLSRFVPERRGTGSAPSIYITGLRVEGSEQRVSELGESTVAHREFPAGQNEVSVDFIGVDASLGHDLRYQYRLEGSQSDWSQATDQRTINFASLAAGTYRFTVRAINAEGHLSPMPASFGFVILQPVWHRWWFLGLVALVFITTAYAVYRYRVARLLAVANLRTRIATDLHDDIGANLTKIAILSEVARQHSENGEDAPNSPLASIARISRESVSSMSDIVLGHQPRARQSSGAGDRRDAPSCGRDFHRAQS